MRGLSRASQDRIADTSGLAGETLNAIQTVQAFTLEELQSERYRKAVEDSFAAAIRRTRLRAALTGLGIFMVFAAITFVLWLGAHQVLAGTMTGGQLAQFLLYAALRRQLRGGAFRDVGRVAARRGRHGASDGASRGAARHRRAARAAARAAARGFAAPSASTT